MSLSLYSKIHDKIARGQIILLKTNILKQIGEFEVLALYDRKGINSLRNSKTQLKLRVIPSTVLKGRLKERLS